MLVTHGVAGSNPVVPAIHLGTLKTVGRRFLKLSRGFPWPLFLWYNKLYMVSFLKNNIFEILLGIIILGIVLFVWNYNTSKKSISNVSTEKLSEWTSPTDEQIAFIKDGNIWLITTDGKQEIRLTELLVNNGFGAVSSFDFSPDQSKITFLRDVGSNYLYILDMVSGEGREIETSDFESTGYRIESNIVWINDSVAFLKNPGAHLWLLDPTRETEEEIFQRSGFAKTASVLKSGNKLFITTDDNSPNHDYIWSIDPATKESELVADLGTKAGDVLFDVSRDGKVVYITYPFAPTGEKPYRTHMFYLIEKPGEQPKPIAEETQDSKDLYRTRFIKGLSWSPDGEYFAYLNPKDPYGDYLIVRDKFGNKIGRSYPEELGEASLLGFSWSPDSSRLAISAKKGLWIVSRDGTILKKITGNGGAHPVWLKSL